MDSTVNRSTNLETTQLTSIVAEDDLRLRSMDVATLHSLQTFGDDRTVFNSVGASSSTKLAEGGASSTFRTDLLPTEQSLLNASLQGSQTTVVVPGASNGNGAALLSRNASSVATYLGNQQLEQFGASSMSEPEVVVEGAPPPRSETIVPSSGPGAGAEAEQYQRTGPEVLPDHSISGTVLTGAGGARGILGASTLADASGLDATVLQRTSLVPALDGTQPQVVSGQAPASGSSGVDALRTAPAADTTVILAQNGTQKFLARAGASQEPGKSTSGSVDALRAAPAANTTVILGRTGDPQERPQEMRAGQSSRSPPPITVAESAPAVDTTKIQLETTQLGATTTRQTSDIDVTTLVPDREKGVPRDEQRPAEEKSSGSSAATDLEQTAVLLDEKAHDQTRLQDEISAADLGTNEGTELTTQLQNQDPLERTKLDGTNLDGGTPVLTGKTETGLRESISVSKPHWADMSSIQHASLHELPNLDITKFDAHDEDVDSFDLDSPTSENGIDGGGLSRGGREVDRDSTFLSELARVAKGETDEDQSRRKSSFVQVDEKSRIQYIQAEGVIRFYPDVRHEMLTCCHASPSSNLHASFHHVSLNTSPTHLLLPILCHGAMVVSVLNADE